MSHLRFRLTLPSMLEASRNYAADVIDACQQKWDCIAASHIARRTGKPLIIHLHYTVGPWLGKQALQTLLTCDHIVTVADFIRDQALAHGVAPERVTTIHNPMRVPGVPATDTRSAIRCEFGIPIDAPVVGIAARLVPEKGHADTIEAFAQTVAAHPDAHLLIVGDGVSRACLEDQAAKTGLGPRIIFAGHRTDVPNVLPAIDVFAHPSRNDACPLAVLEAAATGLPIVAYAEGGLPELVLHEKTGLLAPPGDIAGLGAVMGALLADPETRRRMGAAGREWIAGNFDPGSRGSAFNEIVSKVVQGVEK
jgi:glycosyltransferase involved in cell wall biosynthesis